MSFEQRREDRRARIVQAPQVQHVAIKEAATVKTPDWMPSDPVFFHKSVVSIAAALRPVTLADDDTEKARDLARDLAKALCGGGFPADYMTHRNLMVLTHQVRASEELNAAERATAKNTMSVGEVGRARARIEAHSKGRPIPTREELNKINEADLSDLSDLSDLARSCALDAVVVTLAKRDDITGARRDDAFHVLVAAIELSISEAEKVGLAVATAAEDEVVGPDRFPYPGNIAVEFVLAAAGNGEDRDDAAEGAAST